MTLVFKSGLKRLKAGNAERKGHNTMQGKQIIHLAIFERFNCKSPFNVDIKTPDPSYLTNIAH